MNKTKHLDVGCGSSPRNPFACDELYGVDIIQQQCDDFNYQQCNIILEKLPFDDAYFDSISAYDFLEHIPRLSVIKNEAGQNTTVFPFIDFMNEAYRILKPNGIFYAITPCYPHPAAFVDPTHVNIITRRTHKYFTAPRHRAKMYGFTGKFEVIRVKRLKFSQETKKHSPLVKALKNILYTILPNKKSHILWEFKAIKES